MKYFYENMKYFYENMKYFYENNEIFSFLTSRLLFSVSRSRLLFIVMERAMMMMMMMMMMMKEVELVVEMRSASCRTDLQGLQLLLSAGLDIPPRNPELPLLLQKSILPNDP